MRGVEKTKGDQEGRKEGDEAPETESSEKVDEDFSDEDSDSQEDDESEGDDEVEEEDAKTKKLQPKASTGKSGAVDVGTKSKKATSEKSSSKTGSKGPVKRKREEGNEEGSDSQPEILEGLSGDEVDKSNIIEGGRTTRRGRARSTATQIRKYQEQKARDSDEDSW